MQVRPWEAPPWEALESRTDCTLLAVAEEPYLPSLGVISKQSPPQAREEKVEPSGAAYGPRHLPCSLSLAGVILPQVQDLLV